MSELLRAHTISHLNALHYLAYQIYAPPFMPLSIRALSPGQSVKASEEGSIHLNRSLAVCNGCLVYAPVLPKFNTRRVQVKST